MESECFVFGQATPWDSMGAGIRRQVLGYDAGVMLVSVHFDEGSIGPLHQHPHRQVSYVISGTFEVRIGDQVQVLSAGDSFIIPPDVPHGARAIEAGALIDVFAPSREDFVKMAPTTQLEGR